MTSQSHLWKGWFYLVNPFLEFWSVRPAICFIKETSIFFFQTQTLFFLGSFSFRNKQGGKMITPSPPYTFISHPGGLGPLDPDVIKVCTISLPFFFTLLSECVCDSPLSAPAIPALNWNINAKLKHWRRFAFTFLPCVTGTTRHNLCEEVGD